MLLERHIFNFMELIIDTTDKVVIFTGEDKILDAVIYMGAFLCMLFVVGLTDNSSQVFGGIILLATAM